MGCEYCLEKKKLPFKISDWIVGRSHIVQDQLIFMDGTVPRILIIKYCPMCGRDVRDGE